MNTELFNILSKGEEYFYTVIKAQYKRATPNSLNDELADAYDKLTGEKINRNWNCNSCNYNSFLKMAKLYYQLKEQVSVKNEPDLKTNELKSNVTNNEIKKPKGRPKKK